MARIRTVKPEFWGHPKTARISRDARLLFLGLLNESDDEGYQLGSPKTIAGVVFPNDDDVTPQKVTKWLDELERVRLVFRYEVDGVRYLLLPGFTEHQKVSHPSPSRLPRPSGEVPEKDGECPEGLAPDLGPRNKDLGNGSRTVGTELALVASEVSEYRDPSQAIFDAWVESTQRTGCVLTKERRALILKQLTVYPVEDLIDAVRGWRWSSHHRGENERQTVYNDIELLLRNSKQIENFRDLERGGNRPSTPVGKTLTAVSKLVIDG